MFTTRLLETQRAEQNAQLQHGALEESNNKYLQQSSSSAQDFQRRSCCCCCGKGIGLSGWPSGGEMLMNLLGRRRAASWESISHAGRSGRESVTSGAREWVREHHHTPGNSSLEQSGLRLMECEARGATRPLRDANFGRQMMLTELQQPAGQFVIAVCVWFGERRVGLWWST